MICCFAEGASFAPVTTHCAKSGSGCGAACKFSLFGFSLREQLTQAQVIETRICAQHHVMDFGPEPIDKLQHDIFVGFDLTKELEVAAQLL
jgi:hypothetical protein